MNPLTKLHDYTISDCEYNFGVRFRIYPTKQQRRIIKFNSDVTRHVYNTLIGYDQSIYQCKKDMINSILPWDTRVQMANRAKVMHALHDEEFPDKKQLDKIANDIMRTKRIPMFANYKPYLDHIAYVEEHKKHIAQLPYERYWMQDPERPGKLKKELDSNTVNYAIRNYKTAMKNYFDGLQSRPKKHYKDDHPYEESYQTYINPKNRKLFVDATHIQLPKMSNGVNRNVKCEELRDLLSMEQAGDFVAGTITVSKDAKDSYWVSLQLGADHPFVEPLPKTGNMIGIDLNIENFLTDNNGNVIDNPRYFVKGQPRLAKAQRVLSHRRTRAENEKRNLKEAVNYQKMRRKVAGLSLKIRNKRTSFLHKLSTEIIRNNDIIVTEELRASNIIKNHNLAKHISDVGWRTFITMLEYKAELYGRTMVTIDATNTTQTCHDCGYIMGTAGKEEKLKLSDRKWTCPNCGVFHIRDQNAAQNILQKGLDKIEAEKQAQAEDAKAKKKTSKQKATNKKTTKKETKSKVKTTKKRTKKATVKTVAKKTKTKVGAKKMSSLDNMGNASNERREQTIMKVRQDFNEGIIRTVKSGADKYVVSESTMIKYCKDGNIPLWNPKKNESVVPLTDENMPKWLTV